MTEIGAWEMFIFAASLLSFFWVTGIIQSLLPLYHRNRTYRKLGEHGDGKSPELFNAFILLTLFSVLVFLTGHSVKGLFNVPGLTENPQYLNLLLLYILLSNPVCLIEYIYLLNNRSYRNITVTAPQRYRMVNLRTTFYNGCKVDLAHYTSQEVYRNEDFSPFH